MRAKAGHARPDDAAHHMQERSAAEPRDKGGTRSATETQRGQREPEKEPFSCFPVFLWPRPAYSLLRGPPTRKRIPGENALSAYTPVTAVRAARAQQL